jgi:ribosomal protein S18 acetylase RimI-like enzyme
VRRALANGFELDDDPARIDVRAVHAFISGQSYWGRGRPFQLVARAIRGSSRVVGLYRAGEQVGFARAVTDGAIFAYLADVYVLPECRGLGLGLELVRETVEGLGADAGGEAGEGSQLRWMLHTADAQGLYARLGFSDHAPVYPLMERPAGHARVRVDATTRTPE